MSPVAIAVLVLGWLDYLVGEHAGRLFGAWLDERCHSDGLDALARAQAYEGEIDLLITDVVMPQMSGRQLADLLLAERPNLAVVYASGYRENPSFATYFIACNVHRGPLADRALRRQIAEAIDRPRLARQTLGRLVKPAQGLIPPGLLGYEAETGSSVAPVDTPQAGLRDIELNCLVHSVFLSEYRAYFRRLCETLAVLGIRLKVLEGYHNLYDLPEPEKKLDLTITRWFGDFPDAHTFCGTLHTREGVFGPLVGSERFDKLLEKGQVTADPQARHAIYRQIDELIADEACIIPLFHPQTYRFARPEVEGLAVSHDGPVVAYEELSLRGDEG